MGSHLIEIRGIQIRKGSNVEERIRKVYREAVAESDYSDGHDPYSGGWNTVRGVEIPRSSRLDSESSTVPCPRCWGEGVTRGVRRSEMRVVEKRCGRCQGNGRTSAKRKDRSVDGVFPSLDAARSWAEEKVDKWEAGAAVRYRDGRKVRWAIFGKAVS